MQRSGGANEMFELCWLQYVETLNTKNTQMTQDNVKTQTLPVELVAELTLKQAPKTQGLTIHDQKLNAHGEMGVP